MELSLTQIDEVLAPFMQEALQFRKEMADMTRAVRKKEEGVDDYV